MALIKFEIFSIFLICVCAFFVCNGKDFDSCVDNSNPNDPKVRECTDTTKKCIIAYCCTGTDSTATCEEIRIIYDGFCQPTGYCPNVFLVPEYYNNCPRANISCFEA
ncbi:hypothetical protein Mgra_00002991 [Meloidogyne graminicola]|uniref:Uncharacterized protein n=1 Tax=Meloidogyne graminicola TaxID=189291 RepID=A0A8S9ZUT7_9BILA|nr:hypothetical protein Mgra_00002991 [Meloidogyne graminicola]